MMRCPGRALVLALALAAQDGARAAAQTPAAADTAKHHTESNATRLFFAPTGRTLDAHRGYIADYEIFLPMVAYGITDRVTLAGGMSIVPAVKLSDQVFYFSPKIGVVKSSNVNVAIGALIIHPGGLDCRDASTCNLGVAYAAGTVGPPDANFTGGVGFGFINGSFSSDPFVVLGANKRVSRKIALITENWIAPAVDNQALVSGGVRFFGESLTVDFALATVIGGGDDNHTGLIPYVDFAFHF